MLADAEGMVGLVDHLIADGRSRLGMIAGGSRSRSARARLDGFRRTTMI